MGGMGDSGLGRRHGSEGILRFTEAQTVATQRLMPIGPSHGLDDRQFAGLLTTGLKALKALRVR
jgi:succinate-semialdehyde dehydrogenase/glutarate-semialdehyde dehydrogenase